MKQQDINIYRFYTNVERNQKAKHNTKLHDPKKKKIGLPCLE